VLYPELELERRMPKPQIEGMHDSSFELLKLIDYIASGEDQDITPSNSYQSAGTIRQGKMVICVILNHQPECSLKPSGKMKFSNRIFCS
jgi:hypothetical protein